jgi:predicted RND superfamily exporter protein
MSRLLPRLLEYVAHLAWERPKAILAFALVLSVIAGSVVWGLPVDATFMGILDEDEPAVIDLMAVSQEFGAASGLVLVIEGGDEDTRRLAAKEVTESLAHVSIVTAVQSEIDRDAALEYGLVYLDDEQFGKLEAGVTQLAPVLQALDQEPTLESGLGALRSELGQGFANPRADPNAAQALDTLISMMTLIREGAQAPLTPEQIDDLSAFSQDIGDQSMLGLPLRDGHLASPDGAIYVVDVRTTLDPMNIELGMSGFQELEDAVDPVRAAHPELWMNFAGLLPGGFQDQNNIMGRVMPLSTLSLVLVLLALFALDRRPITPVLVGTGLLMSLLWTFALVRMVFGYASLTSLAFGILLFGLGVDYAVHVVVRFNDERARGIEGAKAMAIALSRTGRGVVIGALTTMSAFALMVLTDFKAATHLGITAAMGLGCALFIMVVVLPAALRVTDGMSRRDKAAGLHLPFIDAVVRTSLDNPRAVMAVVGVVVLGSLAMIPRFRIETDLEKLITQDLPAMEANEMVAQAFGGGSEAVLSVSTNLEQARERAVAFSALDTVVRVEGVQDFIPEDVDQRLDRNRRLQPVLAGLEIQTEGRQSADIQAIGEHLAAFKVIGSRITSEATFAGRPDLANKGRELQAAAQEALDALPGGEQNLAASERLILERAQAGLAGLQQGSSLWRYGIEELPEPVRERYVRGEKLVTYVYPSDYRIDYDFLVAFKTDVYSVDPGAVGTLFVVDRLVVGGLEGVPWAMAAIMAALSIILWADLGRPKRVLVALVPLVLGTLVALALLLAFNMPISVLMMSAAPVVFGIGIDDGVHILHRYDEGDKDIATAVGATGKAILFTSVTTSLGFSILFLLNHRGLAGLAAMVLLGVTTCFVSSITVLPVLARWAARK